jgi:DNA-directed RNA polymerase subunit K/omega
MPFVKVPEGVIDGYLIALKELEEKKIPFIIRRPLPNRGSEYWHLEDLQIIN